MKLTINTTAADLDERFLAAVKTAFAGEYIEITVESDDTSYLMAHPANRETLLRRIADIKEGCNLVTPDQSMFRAADSETNGT
jgi:hypothetical protein